MSLIQRSLSADLKAELENDKIILITGPRQAGKTTLLNELLKELQDKKQTVFFYNFDRIADLEFFDKQQKIEAFLKIRSIKSRMYILIDEVQRKHNAGNFFKFFYDIGLNVKFIFSGSSSLEFTESFGDALTGRKQVFALLPFSLSEIALSRLGEEFNYAKQGDPLALRSFSEMVDEALIWGTYPEVSKNELTEKKLRALGELYESYVQRDIKDLLKVKNVSGFNLLVKVLAHNIGQPLVIEELVRQTGLHANTVNSYLDILDGTLIIARTENFNPDYLDSLPKSRRFYFIDNGMRNYSLGQLQDGFRSDYTALASNLVYSELRKALEYGHLGEKLGAQFNKSTIYHYQTYSDNHLDFVLQSTTTNKYLPISVRYPDNNNKLGKKLHEFINTMKPEKLIIITKDFAAEEEVKGTKVVFMPLADFLLK